VFFEQKNQVDGPAEYGYVVFSATWLAWVAGCAFLLFG
jgi:hypothetical protein